jgi:hypothetical protein
MRAFELTVELTVEFTIGLVVGIMVVPAMGHAQDTLRLSAKDSAAAVAAWAVSDTGRMVAGYHDLSRYTTPGMCVQVMRGTLLQELWRRNDPPPSVIPVQPGSEADTLPTAAIANVRRCIAKLPAVSAVQPLELSNVMQLGVMTNDTALREAAIARMLALATTDEARGYVLLDAMDAMLGPSIGDEYHRTHYDMRVAGAEPMLARLDALGAGARLPRMLAHFRMAEIYSGVKFDTTLLAREVKATWAIVPLLKDGEEKERYNPSYVAIMDSLIIAWSRQQPNRVETVRGMLQRGYAAFTAQGFVPMGTPEWQKLVSIRMEEYASEIGTPRAPVQGDFWFSSDSSHVKPALGKVTLLVAGHKGRGTMTQDEAMYKRLSDRYGKDGFEIVLVVNTDGYSWSSPPQAAADEAKTIAWYFRDYLKIPVTVVVNTSQFTRTKDGRRVLAPPLHDTGGPFGLVGRDGKMFTVWIGTESEAALESYIQAALAQK